MRERGVEPRLQRWQRRVLTTGLLTPIGFKEERV